MSDVSVYRRKFPAPWTVIDDVLVDDGSETLDGESDEETVYGLPSLDAEVLSFPLAAVRETEEAFKKMARVLSHSGGAVYFPLGRSVGAKLYSPARIASHAIIASGLVDAAQNWAPVFTHMTHESLSRELFLLSKADVFSAIEMLPIQYLPFDANMSDQIEASAQFDFEQNLHGMPLFITGGAVIETEVIDPPWFTALFSDQAELPKGALRIAFSGLRSLFNLEGGPGAIDRLLAKGDFSRMPPDAIVGLMRYSYPMRTALPSWREALSKARGELTARCLDVEELLQGLDAPDQ